MRERIRYATRIRSVPGNTLAAFGHSAGGSARMERLSRPRLSGERSHDLEELLGAEFGAVDSKATSARLAIEVTRLLRNRKRLLFMAPF